MTEVVGFYEADIKLLILNKRRMFGNIGKSSIVFEKALSKTKDKRVEKVIADCLVFTERAGLIGIEIKTERDSTKRLLKQLRAYSLTCDFVYVMCHDLHVAKVEQLMKRYKLQHVGIIAYTSFRGKPTAGIYKHPELSPHKEVFHALNMLWKKELLALLGTLRHPAPRIEEELGISSYKVGDRKGMYGLHGDLVKSSYGNRMTKSQIIMELISRLGTIEANQVLCDVFINDLLHPERAIKLRHFNPIHDPLQVGGTNE